MAIVSAWTLKQLSDEQEETERKERHVPDFYLENFSAVSMDENGDRHRQLMAEFKGHYPDTDTYELEKPYMILYHPSRPAWHVRSERGWVSSNEEVLLLLGEVHIWREDGAGGRALDIVTRDLRVLPESDYGETDKPVVLRTPTTESRGIGMRAYLDQRRVELLSRVRTVYER